MIPFKDDNPTRKTPYVTIALIVINCLVFIYEFSLGAQGFKEFTFKYGLIPAELTSGRDLSPLQYGHLATSPYLNVFTSMFMHGGIVHLGGNMLYLWIFGDNIEDTLGPVKFVLFYLVGGVIASLTHVLTDPSSQIPMVGASGAIAAVLGAYLVRFPHARILTLIFLFFFIRIVYLPAILVLGFWFLLQLLHGSSTVGGGGVAFWAHIGGFVFGVAAFFVFGYRPVRRRKYDRF